MASTAGRTQQVGSGASAQLLARLPLLEKDKSEWHVLGDGGGGRGVSLLRLWRLHFLGASVVRMTQQWRVWKFLPAIASWQQGHEMAC